MRSMNIDVNDFIFSKKRRLSLMKLKHFSNKKIYTDNFGVFRKKNHTL